ncbi:hypothetical protein [Deinococcus daejeonensis]|uniref:hypothetical protein n=1 Tax=Deinococcus daejeonensis TaxID=1007098 RepID=UPI0016666013|nr:hypothetical protein [Deinococcus daejeonensis]
MTFLLNRAEQQVLQLDQRLHLIQSAREEDLIHEVFGLLDLTTSEYTLTSALGDLGRPQHLTLRETDVLAVGNGIPRRRRQSQKTSPPHRAA